MDFHKGLIAEFEHEAETTRKLIDATPDGADFNYKPAEKSMTYSQLTGHVVSMIGDWAKMTLTQDSLDMKPDEYKPWLPTSKAELLEKLDGNVAATKNILSAFNAADWERSWKLTGNGQVYFELSKYMTWRTMVMNHIIHHRGQFSVYLRHFGAKLPGIYGPSADGM